MTFRSIRSRLMLWLGFLSVCLLVGFGVTAYQLHWDNLLDKIDSELDRRVAAVRADANFRNGPGPGHGRDRLVPGSQPAESAPPRQRSDSDFRGPPDDFPDRHNRSREGPRSRRIQLTAQTLNLFNEADTNGFYFAFWSRDKDLLRRSTNAPPDLQAPARSADVTVVNRRMAGDRREVYHFTEMGERVLVGRNIASDLEALHRFGWLLAAAGAAVLVLGQFGGWWLVTRTIRPIQQISTTANRIAEGNLSARINVAETDSELGKLAGVLNSTFTRLEAAFVEQKQFTANASHEIRTPLAVLISEAQTTLAHDRTAAEYRETIEACLDTAQQMRRLTESLLQLARFDAGQEVMSRAPFDLADLTLDCVNFVRPLANESSLQIQCGLSQTPLRGDKDRIRQVVINVLSNAVQYNRLNGEIQVQTHPKNGDAYLTISNTGPGIPSEDLPHVFERFYRSDKSRSNANGRNGLGLAICQAVVSAHGGKIEVSSEPGSGATFTIRLPA